MICTGFDVYLARNSLLLSEKWCQVVSICRPKRRAGGGERCARKPDKGAETNPSLGKDQLSCARDTQLVDVPIKDNLGDAAAFGECMGIMHGWRLGCALHQRMRSHCVHIASPLVAGRLALADSLACLTKYEYFYKKSKDQQKQST